MLLRFRAELEAREKLGDQAPDDLTGFPAGDDASSDDAVSQATRMSRPSTRDVSEFAF